MRERIPEVRERIPDVRERIPDVEIGRADLRRAEGMVFSSGNFDQSLVPRHVNFEAYLPCGSELARELRC
jgi:hypothetical protein